MSIIDDLTNAGSGMVDAVLGMTDLDDKLIAEATEKIGAENVEKLKGMIARLADGSVSHDDIVATAKEMGVPEMAIEMVIKFLGK